MKVLILGLISTSFNVDTIIRFGVDKYPVASRTVATRPGTDTLDIYTIYGFVGVIVELSTRTTFTLFIIVE